ESGELRVENANLELGNGAIINLTSIGNRVQFSEIEDGKTRFSGLGIGKGIDLYPYPVSFVGTSENTSNLSALDNSFRGLITHSKTSLDQGATNVILGDKFTIRKSQENSRQYVFNLDKNTQEFYGAFADDYDYRLGTSLNRWSEIHGRDIYGTLASTSSYNAKMNIEDLDGKKAFDYFDQMIVKTFFYQDDDYTNKFNRKVSPIIEQLDPVL